MGAEVLREANVLMPDGTLWFVTYNGLIDGDWLIVGVETGTGPGWVMNGRYGGGGNWARTNAPLAEAPTPDAGVPDSGATEPPDAGVASPDADVGP